MSSATEGFTLSLAMDLEAPKSVKNGPMGNIYSGYFRAPATAKYRFYLACDDSCQLHMSTVDKDPSKKTLIYQSDTWASYRNYFTLNGRKMTDWLDL